MRKADDASEVYETQPTRTRRQEFKFPRHALSLSSDFLGQPQMGKLKH